MSLAPCSRMSTTATCRKFMVCRGFGVGDGAIGGNRLSSVRLPRRFWLPPASAHRRQIASFAYYAAPASTTTAATRNEYTRSFSSSKTSSAALSSSSSAARRESGSKKKTKKKQEAATAVAAANSNDDNKPKTTKANKPPPRPLTGNFEEDFHLSRSLSRGPAGIVDPRKRTEWAEALKKKETRGGDYHDEWTKDAAVNWYASDYSQPRYEMEALRQIHKLSFGCNVLLEIRDARVPSSSHHPSFTRLAKHRRHLICYTHADVLDSAARDRVRDWTVESWPDSKCIFVDCRENRTNDEVDAGAFDEVYGRLLRNLDERGGNTSAALTVGVANTGKSSFLLALLRHARRIGAIPKVIKTRNQHSKRGLKKSRAPPIEDKPGKTREITQYLLREKPRAFFLDVPGMTPPGFFFRERPEAFYAFGAANLLPLSKRMKEDAHLQANFCDYVLHCANRDGEFAYVDKLGLEDGPTTNIGDCLERLSNKHKGRLSEEVLRLKRCETFLKLFGTGNFGPIVLDDLRFPYRKFTFRDEHYRKGRKRRSDDDWEGSDDGEFDFDEDEDDHYEDW